MKHFPFSCSRLLSSFSLPFCPFPLPPSSCMSFICCLVLDPLQRGILTVGAADPHRCPMTGYTDGSIVSRFPMPTAKKPVYHAPVGKRDSQSSSQGGSAGQPPRAGIRVGRGSTLSPLSVLQCSQAGAGIINSMSYPQMSGMYILNPAFLRLRSRLPPDVKDNSRTQVHACMLSCFSCVQLFATLWTVARQVPQSMGFSRQECWSGLPCPPPGDLPDPGIETGFPALQVDSQPPAKPSRTCSSP